MRQLLAFALLVLAATSAVAQSPGKDQAAAQHFDIRAESLPLPGGPIPYVSNAPERIPRGDHAPLVPKGFTVTLFADGLPHPRRIEVTPTGLVFIVQQGSGQVLQFSDTDNDGTADRAGTLATGFNNPFGLALIPSGPNAGDLLLADADAVWRIPLATGGQIARVTPPGAFGPPQGHITRTLLIEPQSGDLIVTVGSIANLAEEPEPKATIQRFAADGTAQQTIARGLRNATGIRLHPATGDLYAVVMERDAMGDELVPDYFTHVEQGDDFGWPYQYAGGFAQPEFAIGGTKRVASKLPDVLFEAHSAPMDLIFLPDSWPEDYRGDAIVALKGSSNRETPTGYKLVRIPFADGRPAGGYDNFATGFWIAGDGPAQVWARPAALGLLPDGGLLVADDFAGSVWKITPPKAP